MTGLHGELQQTRSSWAARVAAAGLVGRFRGRADPAGGDPRVAGRAGPDRGRDGDPGRCRSGREVVGRIGTYETVINDAVRLLADHGLRAAGRAGRRATAGARSSSTGAVRTRAGTATPLMAGYAADPVNTALGNFVEVETDLSFGGLLAGLTFARTYNSRSDRVGRSVRAGRRGRRPAWWRAPGPRSSRVRTGSGSRSRAPGRASGGPSGSTRWWSGRPVRPGAGVVRRAALGVRRRGPGGAHLGRPGHRGPFGHDDDGRLVELVHERGRRLGLEWERRPHRGACPARTGGASPTATTRDCWPRRTDRRGARRYGSDAAGRVVSVTDADGVVELVNTYDEPGPGADPALAVRAAGHLLLRVGRDDGGRRRLRGPDQRLPARPRRAAGRGHRRARAHAAQALRRLGEPGRDRRAGRRGDPPGVRRPRAPRAPHARRPGRCSRPRLGRRGPGGERSRPLRRGDPLRLRRAPSASRPRSSTPRVGSPGCRWPAGWCRR